MRKLVCKNSALQSLFCYGPHKYKKSDCETIGNNFYKLFLVTLIFQLFCCTLFEIFINCEQILWGSSPQNAHTDELKFDIPLWTQS